MTFPSHGGSGFNVLLSVFVAEQHKAVISTWMVTGTTQWLKINKFDLGHLNQVFISRLKHRFLILVH